MFRIIAPILILGGITTWAGIAPAAAPPPKTLFLMLPNQEAWARLPRMEPALPAWARVLAESLPLTTTRMIELDHLHRARNPLGVALAARIRRECADAIGCAYAKSYAEADLRRATSRDASKKEGFSPQAEQKAERSALAFASKLTRAGHEVTDAEVAELIHLFGPEKVVAMVHTIAFANFQNRVFLALKVEVERDGPLPSLGVRFDPNPASAAVAPARPSWKAVRAAKSTPKAIGQPDWDGRKFGELEKSLAQQKLRQSRIPLPGKDQFARIPPEAKAQASRVLWTNISMGYQPQLTKAWFDCMRVFSQEARMDPVFSGSLFWIVTRTNDCFY